MRQIKQTAKSTYSPHLLLSRMWKFAGLVALLGLQVSLSRKWRKEAAKKERNDNWSVLENIWTQEDIKEIKKQMRSRGLFRLKLKS